MTEREVPVRVRDHLIAFFHGRDAIRAGYEASPPDDTMEVIAVESEGDADRVRFRWSRGGAGTMALRWEGHLVAELEVHFDDDTP